MYLTNALILNSGAIEKLKIEPQFNPDGTPKPIVLVGTNGSGKTNVLSIIADGLIEIAAQHYQNITPQTGITRQFFRTLGGRSQRIVAQFELSAMKFLDNTHEFFYRAKSGTVSLEAVSDDMEPYKPLAHWPDENIKNVVGPNSEIERIYRTGAYIFFPSTRFEVPYWANLRMLDREPEGDFSVAFSANLDKPIVVQSAIQTLKPWIMNLMLDTIVNSADIFTFNTIEEIRIRAQTNLTYMTAYSGLIAIIRAILRRQDASVHWLNRAFGERRIAVVFGNQIGIPSLDNFSSGQSSLLSIFGTVLRYGDTGMTSTPSDKINGIVLIDEVDSHLHADLQHDALPELIKMFPRVQFIVASHSALLPLGMRKLYGDEGYSLIELPSGLTIDAERFSEFETSFAFFRATQAFEKDVQDKLLESKRSLVLCEGETDPKYLKASAELLGFIDLSDGVDFEWVGTKTALGQSEGGGAANLDNALRFLRHNPQFITRRVTLLYDCDTGRSSADYGMLFVRSVARNDENKVTDKGIENLLPDEVFEDRFYSKITKKDGAKRTTIEDIRKTEICEHLCVSVRNPQHFSKFSGILSELRKILGPEERAETVVEALPSVPSLAPANENGAQGMNEIIQPRAESVPDSPAT